MIKGSRILIVDDEQPIRVACAKILSEDGAWRRALVWGRIPSLSPGGARRGGVDFRLLHPVSNLSFKKLVAILRLAVPYTGMIISTRESVEMRTEAFSLGISQTSAGSRTPRGPTARAGKTRRPGKASSSMWPIIARRTR